MWFLKIQLINNAIKRCYSLQSVWLFSISIKLQNFNRWRWERSWCLLMIPHPQAPNNYANCTTCKLYSTWVFYQAFLLFLLIYLFKLGFEVFWGEYLFCLCHPHTPARIRLTRIAKCSQHTLTNMMSCQICQILSMLRFHPQLALIHNCLQYATSWEKFLSKKLCDDGTFYTVQTNTQSVYVAHRTYNFFSDHLLLLLGFQFQWNLWLCTTSC